MDIDEVENDGPDAQRRLAFRLLQPCCSQLLQLRTDAVGLAAELAHLGVLLRGAPRSGLQGCMDYVLFPLLLMADSVAMVRGLGTGSGAVAGVLLGSGMQNGRQG